MRKLYTLVLFVCMSMVSFAQLTVEKIMENPSKWIGTAPSNIFWSEDSKTIYFSWNPEKNMADSLYKITLDNRTPQKVSLAEKATLSVGGFGFRSDAYSRDFGKKLYLKNGDVYIQDTKTLQENQLTNTLDRKGSPYFNLDESKVIYSSGNDIYTIDLASGKTSQLTNFSSENKRPDAKPGEADKMLEKDQLDLFDVLKEAKAKKEAREAYTKLTEIKKPKNISLGGKMLQGAVASPDLNYVFYRLSEMPRDAKRTIVPNYVTESGYTVDIPTRTKVGQPSGSTEAYIYHIAKDTVLTISTKDIPGIEDVPAYLADYPQEKTDKKKTAREVSFSQPVWSPNGTHAIINLRATDNKDRWIMKLNPENGSLSLIDRQHDDAWIAGPGIGGFGGGTLNFIDENTLYYQSEESGYSHLYTVDLTTGKKTQLTSGKYEVQGVDLSKDKKWFYLTTNEVHPGEKHFYKMPVTGGERIKITQLTGGNEVTLSPDEKTLALRYSNTNTPWELYIQENNPTAKAEKITSSLTDDFKAYAWKTPQVISFKASDGQDIYARVYEPSKKKKNGKAVVFVHGAGYLQNAHKWWSQYFREYMFHNLLVDQGYTVLDMDFRASSGYGRDVRTGIYRHMGGKDLTDNVDGAKLLVDKYGINPKKIGIYGGSYGGFITLMAMFTTPDVFAAGAALRPVTDWAAYNHGYTANILNEPQTDPIAYRRSSPIFHAAGLKGKLLMCHGQVDVNVHIQDTYRLAQRLIELRKENWEVASYPVEDHGFTEPTSWMDEYKRILKLFNEM
jgi:dipeptidyl aminopeptidase/acylaminoacyl peptidase